MPIILNEIRYAYKRGTSLERQALKGVSLTASEGKFLALAGRTGSGKSTLALIMAGLLAPDSGCISIGGKDLAKVKPKERRALRLSVGMVFQYPEAQLFADTVAEDIAFGPKNLELTEDEVQKRVQAAMEAVHLSWDTFADKSPFMLSGGEKRRVAIAGVLALHPRILILDEPTAGLDPRARESLLQKLQELKDSGMGIVLISHNMEDILRLADEVAVLKEGEIVLQGTPQEVFVHTDTLRAANLEPPPLLHLLAELKHHGLPLKKTAFTEEEAVQEILVAIKAREVKPC